MCDPFCKPNKGSAMDFSNTSMLPIIGSPMIFEIQSNLTAVIIWVKIQAILSEINTGIAIH